jgi:hypothetical protein
MRDGTQCEAYAKPMLILHAAFLTAGVIAIALAAEIIFGQTIQFWCPWTHRSIKAFVEYYVVTRLSGR